MHKHRAKTKSQAYGFTRPIPHAIRRNPRAHGCVSWAETCACGCVRAVNGNGKSREAGPWIAPLQPHEVQP